MATKIVFLKAMKKLKNTLLTRKLKAQKGQKMKMATKAVFLKAMKKLKDKLLNQK
jgi:hypothetical protein